MEKKIDTLVDIYEKEVKTLKDKVKTLRYYCLCSACVLLTREESIPSRERSISPMSSSPPAKRRYGAITTVDREGDMSSQEGDKTSTKGKAPRDLFTAPIGSQTAESSRKRKR